MTCVTAQFQGHFLSLQEMATEDLNNIYISQIYIGIENEFDGHLRKQQFQSDKWLEFMGHLEDLFF